MDTDESTSDVALRALRAAVRDEMILKAKLGQDAIVLRDGKPCRVKASELLAEMDRQPKDND